jgi:mycothiol system anti-sigma-R factor
MGDECREALQRLQTYLDGECEASLEVAIRRHLDDCPPCLGRADFERELRAIIARRCKDVAPQGLIDRVIASLRS